MLLVVKRDKINGEFYMRLYSRSQTAKYLNLSKRSRKDKR